MLVPGTPRELKKRTFDFHHLEHFEYLKISRLEYMLITMFSLVATISTTRTISFTGRLLISEVNIVYWIITWLNSLACWVMWSHFNWRTCISAYLCFKFTLAHLVVQLGSFTFIYLSYIFNNGWTDWYPGQYTCIGQHAHIKVFPVWRWNKKSKLQATSYIMESARFVFVKVHTSAHNVGKSS